MKMTIRWNRFATYTTLPLGIVLMLCLQSIDSGWAQNKAGDAVSPSAQAEGFLDLLGDLPNPRRIDVSELHRLPRVEVRTTDPHDPGKEIVYSGTTLVETLKTGGLVVDSGMAGLRDAVKMTVIVEATDGYRAVFSLAELDPELTDRVILLADTKDGQPLPLREGPLRIIVPGEKRPARWVRQVKALTVRNN
jgi:DMSO/TMAO reductase YedYZ molybdopterin-dependent catalytic subunit